MSWLGRLFGARPATPPPANTVVIADDLAATLTAAGRPLTEAVDAAVRGHLDAQRLAAEARARGERLPFWLSRDSGGAGEIEDELRDRVIQRRAAEDES